MSKLSSDSRRLFLTQAGLAGVAPALVDVQENRPTWRRPKVVITTATRKTNKHGLYEEGREPEDCVLQPDVPRGPSVYRTCRTRAVRRN